MDDELDIFSLFWNSSITIGSIGGTSVGRPGMNIQGTAGGGE